MSIKKVCDGCGLESPDSRGLYIANHWVKVHADVPFAFAGRFNRTLEWLLCRRCANKAVAALGVHEPIEYVQDRLRSRQP